MLNLSVPPPHTTQIRSARQRLGIAKDRAGVRSSLTHQSQEKVELKRMKKQSDLRNMFKRMKSHDSSSSSAPNDNASPSNASASLAPPIVTVTPSNVSVAHLNKVISFCNNHGIVVPDLKACYVPHGRSKRFVQQVSYRHHFRIDVFIEVIDLLLQEFDNRFDEVNMELIRCMACFSPRDGFSSSDKESVLKLATFYPSDFSSIDLRSLDCQLDIFMEDMRRDNDFQNLQDLSSLSMKLVETKRDVAYPFVFLLIKLILIVNSGMAFVKNKLRNRIGDKHLNDCLVTFIEKEMFLQVSDDDISHRFEEMKTRRKIN
ncbi:uncharacterized protein LOC121780185 [Salvia splendens]|uniref:uncharacterized protein LOC121780185 n=1 Tax=Salvia splendens TaxID=180675 RepID=UPI001C26058B|nr:uncharacterized protein LOC121780185 [Salvia splendens]